VSVPEARSLRHTVIATLLIGFALLTAVQYLATSFSLTRQFQEIEATESFEALHRLHSAIDEGADGLKSTVADWAIWDDTYRFVEGAEPLFVEDNLDIQTFERLRLNFVAIVRDDGTVLSAQELAPGGQVLQAPDAALVAQAQSMPPDQSGFVPTRFGPVLMANMPIQDSSMREFGNARLIMGRSLAALRPIIASVTDVPFSIEAKNALDASIHAAHDREASVRDQDVVFFGDETIDAYTPIVDLAGAPIALLHARLDRDLQRARASSLNWLLGLTVFVGAAFALAGLIVLRARLVRPIEKLVAAVEAIGVGATKAQRLDENYRERELIALSRAINAMLSQVEGQQSLRADRDAALLATRMKSEFLATMSHEIRTPMNGVLGMCELLQSTELDSRQRHLADTLTRSARSLLGMLNDILDFSKIESGKLSLETAPFSPQEIVQSTCAPFAATAQAKGLEFSIEIDTAVPTLVSGDALRLRQVLNNLLSNAVKFTGSGSITVRCNAERSDATGVKLRIVVDDTGIGIESEAQSRVFDAFAQAESSTTRRFGGTGLGLAIVRRIVELMGGDLGVHSEPGRGSSFWFTLTLECPVVSERSGSTNLLEAKPVRFATEHAPKVLLAEDNPVNREVLVEMLQVIGCDVVAVENGIEALAAAAKAKFDAILMDCQMPVMDGHAATQELRQRERISARAPSFIVALTADATAENRQRCFDVGMDDVLMKPISQTQLHELVLQVVQRTVPIAG
jgi:two-component system, sensor histidine kinase